MKKEFPRKKYQNSKDNPRTELQHAFFTKGGLGAKLIPEYEKVRKSLSLPKFLIEAYRKLDQGHSLDDAELQKVLERLRGHFSEDQHFILPSFYKLIAYLRKIKKEFAILFRSYGEDLVSVSEEFNQLSNQLCQWRASII